MEPPTVPLAVLNARSSMVDLSLKLANVLIHLGDVKVQIRSCLVLAVEVVEQTAPIQLVCMVKV